MMMVGEMEKTLYFESVAQVEPAERAAFIRRTYAHVIMAVLIFMVIETFLLGLPIAGRLPATMIQGFMWLAVLTAFMVVSHIADWMARSATSLKLQYLGLVMYVVAEAIIFLPLLYFVKYYSSQGLIPAAELITAALFAGLTAVIIITRKDFSWLRVILTVGGFVALGVTVASIIFGFGLGVFISSLMIAFASVAILYTTSNVMHEYRTEQHVAASLALFSSVTLLFWYVLSFLQSTDDEN